MGYPQTSAKQQYRNYEDSARQATVENFYKTNHENQSLEFAQAQKEKYCKLQGPEMSVWDACLLLDELVDDSDPDTEHSQIVHLLQTGESLRAQYPGEEYDWLHLTGFIHDLGKILSHPSVFNEPQWCVVGDTYPLGCQFDEKIVFHKYFESNPDRHNPEYNTKFGIYSEGVGIENVTMSWGHDEYLYQVCVRNGSTLPKEGLNIIRFHSFYSWHQGGSYKHLMAPEDEKWLHWVKVFQKHDLYSKLPEKPDQEKLLPYYKGLMEKYFPAILKW